jgi:hypothetical protein
VETSGPDISELGVAAATFASELPGIRFEGEDVAFLEAHAETINDKRIANAANVFFITRSFCSTEL